MNRELRFCMLTTFYPPYNFGGDGISVHQLSNELAKRGHRVDVIHCKDAYQLMARQSLELPYQDHPNVTVHGLKSPWGPLSPVMSQQTGAPFFKAVQIKKVLAKGFDVIHFHNVSLIGGPKLFSLGRGLKLCNLHDHWLVCPTHVLFKFNRKPCLERRCLLCSLVYKRPPQLWRYLSLMKRAARHVDLFIAPSRFCKAAHRERGLAGPVSIMPNLITLPGQTESPDLRERPAQDFPRPFFLFVGRLEKLKGLQTIIPLFKNYKQACLIIAGQGTYEAVLRKLADNNPNIFFLGQVSEIGLQQLYQKAVALIVPSICYESMGRVIIEAFSCALPVIARNIGPLTEIIDANETGILFNTNQELAAAISRFLADRPFTRECGRRAYRAYREKWAPGVVMQRYLDLIEKTAFRSGSG